MNLARFSILFALIILLSKSDCNYSLILVSSDMGNFTTNGYKNPRLDRIFDLLN